MRRSSRSLGPLGTINVVRGEPATERGSIFTAQIAYPISTAAQATAALALMRQEAHCGVADHNMTAYRLAGPKKGSKVTKAYDDDGEAHGGQRLLGCLTKLAACNVAVMVSRVYGGENIGKRRFELICERTTTLLDALGHVPGVGVAHAWGEGRTLGGTPSATASAQGNSGGGKKRKRSAEEEEAERRAAREAAALAAERRLQSLTTASTAPTKG